MGDQNERERDVVLKLGKFNYGHFSGRSSETSCVHP